MSRLLMSMVLLSGLLLGTTGCSKHKVLAKTSLDVNKPLILSFDADLAPCATDHCWVAIADTSGQLGAAVKLTKGSRLIVLEADGSWTAYEAGDAPEAEEEKEELPEDWRDHPIVGYDERKAKALDKAMGNARKEIATGTLAEVEGKRVLELAADLLPVGEFLVYTNGWFGAVYEGERIGTPTRMGLVEVSR